MKFFTLDGWIADQDIGNVDINDIISARKAYNDYLASIADELPPEFTRLGQTIHLGDARLRELDVDLPAKRITLVLDAEDLATGESRGVALLYDEVRRFVSTSDPDKGLPGPHGYGDLGNDEIELLGDRVYEHRFLFSSGIEMAVQFSRFHFTTL